MKYEILSQIRTRLKKLLKDKEILDIIVFGSAIKGKAAPRDIDIAIITDKDVRDLEIEGFHISMIKPSEFFVNQPSIATTILREGYSLKKLRSFAEGLKFENQVLFTYHLKDLRATEKVKIVNILRGKNKEKGIVSEHGGKWLANQVFAVPVESEHIFEQFFINFKINHIKRYILMH